MSDKLHKGLGLQYLGFMFGALGFMVSGFCPEYYSSISTQITFQGLGFTTFYISSKHFKGMTVRNPNGVIGLARLLKGFVEVGREPGEGRPDTP